MTRKEIIYDILNILTRFSFGPDSRLEKDYIGYKIDQYRAVGIKQLFDAEGFIDPSWLQDYGITLTTIVNRADDTSITHCDCSFSKIKLPPIVSLSDKTGRNNHMGVSRITSPCGTKKFYYSSMDKFVSIPKGHPQANFSYYIPVGNHYYFSNSPKRVRPVLILANPLDGFVNENLNVMSGDLVVGKNYIAVGGQVLHNNVAYDIDEVFVAANTEYTGPGIVQLAEPKRPMTNDDEYPASQDLIKFVVLEILTKEFNIERSMASDIVNDGSDQTHLNEAKVTR
jgi:hypothetical protein